MMFGLKFKVPKMLKLYKNIQEYQITIYEREL